MNRKKRAATENISLACSDVKEHKAKCRRRMEIKPPDVPRRRMEIKTPDVPSREALELSAHSRMVGQQPGLCQVSFVHPNPVNS